MRRLLLALVFLAGLPVGIPTAAGVGEQPPVPVVLVLMENHSRAQITASAAPYLTSFANAGRTFTHYNAIEHPSLPNYLDIVSGSNQGCRNDRCPRQTYTANNLFNQVGDWQAWNESMQHPCQLNSQGQFAVKHSPAAYFTDLRSSCPARDVPYPSQVPASLAAFTFVTPNLCNDMHSCSVRTGDNWARDHIPALLAVGAVVIVVFDEGSGSQNVFCAERGPGVPSVTEAAAYNHYGLLHGLEDHFGAAHLGHAGASLPI